MKDRIALAWASRPAISPGMPTSEKYSPKNLVKSKSGPSLNTAEAKKRSPIIAVLTQAAHEAEEDNGEGLLRLEFMRQIAPEAHGTRSQTTAT